MRAHYGAGESIKEKILGSSLDTVRDIFHSQAMYPMAKIFCHPGSFGLLNQILAHLRNNQLKLCSVRLFVSLFARVAKENVGLMYGVYKGRSEILTCR